MVSRTSISLALASAASRMMRASSRVSRLTVIMPSSPRGLRSRHVDPDLLAVDPHRIDRDGHAARGQEARAGAHVEHPAMPGTGQARPRELAFAEGAASVRAGGGAGIDLLPDPGQDHPHPIDVGQRASARGDLREGSRADLHRALSSQLFLENVRAIEARHVLPAHLRGLSHLLPCLRQLLRGGAVPLHDLVAALAMYLVGLDVDGEELDLVVVEAVVRLEGRQVALVDAGHLGLEPDEEPGRRDVEGTLRGLVAPRGEPARGGELLLALDLLAAHPARLREADQEIDVLHSRLLLDDVLEQEIARVRVRALRVHRGAPPRELRHVLVVLARPRAELLAAELALDPFLGERIHPAVPGLHGALEALAEGTLGLAHDQPPA